MIEVLQSYEQITQGRENLKEQGYDFSDPNRLHLWRFIFNLRYRWRSPFPVPDVEKSWDVWWSYKVISEFMKDKSAPVLDMGCFNSEILMVLSAAGYKNLHGIDLNPHCKFMPYWTKIDYSTRDLMNTKFEDEMFGAITCVSVIEHGVDVDAFIKETHRLLRPGGILVLTTDFDATGQEHAIDKDFRVFGQPWCIFNPESFNRMIGEFEAKGFQRLDPNRSELAHNETPIHWNGEKYTFALVALQKQK